MASRAYHPHRPDDILVSQDKSCCRLSTDPLPYMVPVRRISEFHDIPAELNQAGPGHPR